MANHILKAIIEEKVKGFISAFSDTSERLFFDKSGKLIHSGEFGMYRERVCKDIIKTFIPPNLMISDGFIITSDDLLSTQCDIIVYDPTKTPLIEVEHNRFFPIESVKAVFEIKSNLDKASLKDALVKLAHIKTMKRCTTDNKAGDNKNIFTCLVSKSFTFDISDITNWIDQEVYKEVESQHKHNMVLSLKDGILAYCLENCYNTLNTMGFYYSLDDLKGTFFQYPLNLGIPLTSFLIKAHENNHHINTFFSYLKSIGEIETEQVELSRYLGFELLERQLK